MKTKLNPGALSLAVKPMRPMFGMPRFFHDAAGDGGGSAGGGGGTGAGGAGQGAQGGQGGDGGQGGGQGGAPGMIQMTQERFDQIVLDRVNQANRQWEGRYNTLEAELQKLKGGSGSQGGQGGQGGSGDKTYTQADLQQLLAQKDEEYSPKLKAAEDRIASLLEKERSAAIISAAAAAKAVDPQDVALLVGRFVSHDDKGDIVVLNDKGMPRLNGNGDPMTVEEFVKQYVDSKPHLKQAANAGGAGSHTKPGGAPQQQTSQRPKSLRDAARQFGQTMTK
ncbi:hypothetical protein D3C86_876100 [compost metagenome]